jgi:hypothetical protein
MVDTFCIMYEDRKMKPIEVVLRRGKGWWGWTMEQMKLIKIYCKHICKCHNISPLYNYYILIKYFKKKSLNDAFLEHVPWFSKTWWYFPYFKYFHYQIFSYLHNCFFIGYFLLLQDKLLGGYGFCLFCSLP